ncbi:MAG: hypothetical protein KC994_04510 [Candidatus Omnitrophica bacterium]|nr:hypothetical protein [Candidatus Omnitrophota bacterium]
MRILTRLALSVVVLTVAVELHAQGLIPSTINYQGSLLDSAGNPVADATYDVEFRIYAQPTGGTEIWGPMEFDGVGGTGHDAKVATINGRYNVILGPVDTASRQISDIFDGTSSSNDARYVQVTYEGTVILPRQRILSAPYALATLGMVPIGSIIAHHADLSGAAGLTALRNSGFALCDGTTAASQGVENPIITGALPNLNVGNGTGRFLRGTTGTTGALQDDQFQGHHHSSPAHGHTTSAEPHTHTWSQSSHRHSITTGEGDGDPRNKVADGDKNGKPDHTAETEGAQANISINNTAVSITVQPASVNVGDPIQGNNGSLGVGNETRPKSTTILWIMRVR